ncbi:pyruvate formate lyase-activating protein [Prolixibacteraceae bacterium JC049]|nr:pyruvate formate lyase-activating protein [Prolixibacteraceae bacterium JC049]
MKNDNNKLRVHSIESLGTYDGPGIRMVVFLQGCNFACAYCANADTIPTKGGKETDIEELLQLSRSQRPFFGTIGGVTVSGGEPLLQAKSLIELFKKLKAEKFNTCIDTNGSVFTDDVKELMEYTDLVLLDIKHIDEEQHIKLTEKRNEKSLQFADYLKEIDKPIWLRYVLVPGWTDNPDHLHQLGERLKEHTNIEKLEIQPYHSLGVHKYEHLDKEYRLKDVTENTPEQLEKAKEIFSQYFKQVIIN